MMKLMKRVMTTLMIGLFVAVSGLDIGIANAATATSTLAPSKTYVALGDSMAAGLGLPLSDGASETALCGRSKQAYPYLVAQQTQLSLKHIACSGATAGDLVTKQSVAGTNLPAQLDTAFKNGTPGLVSITAGVNDVHWASFLSKCYVSTCGTTSDNWMVYGYMQMLQAKLHYSLADIIRRSHGNPPKVVLTGYYNPLSNACAAVDSHFTANEIAWVSSQTAALNQTIKDVTPYYGFAKFVPVDFTGHDVCSPSSWVQGINAPASFHPTAQGQAAIARSVLSAL